MLEFLGAVGGILLVDLALSVDNALVIGAAAAKLSPSQRRAAIGIGVAVAAILRVVGALLVTFLLRLPYLQLIGGILLLVIAIRLLAERSGQHQPEQGNEAGGDAFPQSTQAAGSFSGALLTILIADVTMSLDNVLAVGALAQGNELALVAGILISVVILILGGALAARLIERLPWLLDLAALVLAWAGAEMILSDLALGPVLERFAWTQIAIPIVALGIVLLADILFRWRERRRAGRLNQLQA